MDAIVRDHELKCGGAVVAQVLERHLEETHVSDTSSLLLPVRFCHAFGVRVDAQKIARRERGREAQCALAMPTANVEHACRPRAKHAPRLANGIHPPRQQVSMRRCVHSCNAFTGVEAHLLPTDAAPIQIAETVADDCWRGLCGRGEQLRRSALKVLPTFVCQYFALRASQVVTSRRGRRHEVGLAIDRRGVLGPVRACVANVLAAFDERMCDARLKPDSAIRRVASRSAGQLRSVAALPTSLGELRKKPKLVTDVNQLDGGGAREIVDATKHQTLKLLGVHVGVCARTLRR
mmetsp:Transcript_20704/g.57825  ORF Transcript_20704/g.57825 Transcript_20704/m.57825 type:complete len:292 (-) Transcript_20704:67-942(-)